ncbi:MAG: hypothetical protein GC189_12715 [Alphaproteobacteria bacterium]|nr:hypothetical protein [Alphaproteobacteria bacterium]
MSSTRPTTSARLTGGWGPVTAAALAAALGCAAFAARDTSAVMQRMSGAVALAQAEALERGAERDRRLADAQTALTNAVGVNAFDAAGWRDLARVRLLQGVAPELGAPSPVLLDAAAQAAENAERLSPHDPDNALIHAQILVARGAPINETAAMLDHAYYAPLREPGARWARFQVAASVWSVLDRSLRAAATEDACAAARYAAIWRDGLDGMAANAADPTLSAAINAVRVRPDCAPADADPESSPPAPAPPQP